MNCIQVCLVLAVGCTMLASANPTSYQLGYSADDLSTVELDSTAIKDCDPMTSSYLVTGSTPAPIMRTASEFVSVSTPAPILSSAVDIEPARIMSVTPSPILSTASEFVSVSTPAPILRSAVDLEPARIMSVTPSPILSTASDFVSVSTPAPILRSAIDIEPARIIDTAPLKLETRIATSPLMNAFRPALATFDSTAWQANMENASPAPIALKTITKTTKLEAVPAIRSQYTLATAAPLIESKIAMPVQRPILPIARKVVSLPSSVSTSYSYIPRTYASSYLNAYTAPQYYSTATKYLAAPQYYSSMPSIAPQFYSSAATVIPQYYSSAPAIAPQYYSSAPAIAPQYYSSAPAIAPQYYSAAPKYYSSVSLAADEPCDK
ncbi:mucin-4-like [Aphis gossypii]|uniref:mucin-4-like n=1 Tax=Aphis gossypii TaxID=80765 RepID=UPI002158ACDB|nr:mucin-4-like [Aphis gossypii]XP_050060990.1 mucin-4-like [Aphis gossypii]